MWSALGWLNCAFAGIALSIGEYPGAAAATIMAALFLWMDTVDPAP